MRRSLNAINQPDTVQVIANSSVRLPLICSHTAANIPPAQQVSLTRAAQGRESRAPRPLAVGSRSHRVGLFRWAPFKA